VWRVLSSLCHQFQRPFPIEFGDVAVWGGGGVYQVDDHEQQRHEPALNLLRQQLSLSVSGAASDAATISPLASGLRACA